MWVSSERKINSGSAFLRLGRQRAGDSPIMAVDFGEHDLDAIGRAPCNPCRLARQDKVPRSRGAIRPSCAVGRSLQGSRGRRECRERSAPAAACATKSTRVSNHRYAASAGIPCAMVLRLMSRSPRGPGSFAPVIPEKLASQELSASVGAPGPHAFAVRNSIARLATPLRPPHPAPNVRDDREAPLLWERDGGKNTQFPIFRK